jgi:hypothetical protein
MRNTSIMVSLGLLTKDIVGHLDGTYQSALKKRPRMRVHINWFV